MFSAGGHQDGRARCRSRWQGLLNQDVSQEIIKLRLFCFLKHRHTFFMYFDSERGKCANVLISRRLISPASLFVLQITPISFRFSLTVWETTRFKIIAWYKQQWPVCKFIPGLRVAAGNTHKHTNTRTHTHDERETQSWNLKLQQSAAMEATMKQDVILLVAYYWKYLKMNSLLLTGETRISFQLRLVSYLVGQNFSKVFSCISFFFLFSFFLINCQIKSAATVTTVRSQRKRSQTCRENLRSAGNSEKRKNRDARLNLAGTAWSDVSKRNEVINLPSYNIFIHQNVIFFTLR